MEQDELNFMVDLNVSSVKVNRKSADAKPIIAALKGHVGDQIPFWLMRQAGRYLPEYLSLRAKAGSFLDLCYNPDFAVEVTLQPLRRFDMDAAILFSDILVVPHALGQNLTFAAGEGPRLDPIRDLDGLSNLGREKFHETLAPVYETVAGVAEKLSKDKTLIGFAGAPWTVATYMVEGGSSRDFFHTKKWAYSHPDQFQKLIDLLCAVTSEYLIKQVEKGADCLQLFDSWSGVLPSDQFRRWVIEPARKIVSTVHLVYPDIPFIGFPRGAGCMLQEYAKLSGVQAVSVDTQVDLKWARNHVKRPIQGNLDPILLLNGGLPMENAIRRIKSEMSGHPFIFNLGHGVIKETPPEHVARLVEIVRE